MYRDTEPFRTYIVPHRRRKENLGGCVALVPVSRVDTQGARLKPSGIDLVGLMNARNYAGLVSRSRPLLSCRNNKRIWRWTDPTIEHLGCSVDSPCVKLVALERRGMSFDGVPMKLKGGETNAYGMSFFRATFSSESMSLPLRLHQFRRSANRLCTVQITERNRQCKKSLFISQGRN